jgi:hypothetical protein
VPGLGVGVSPSSQPPRFHTEEILFLTPAVLDRLVKSTAGEKERKLPDQMLKYMRAEKGEFVHDWMKGYINLERDDEDFAFNVDSHRGGGEKDIRIEYIGMFDGAGRVIGENKLGCPVATRESPKQAINLGGRGCGEEERRERGGHRGEDVVEVSVSRMDIVM